jgi:uncharacterized protein (TIGR02646 family)
VRSIIKLAQPAALRNWKLDNQDSPQNLTYQNLDSATKDQIKHHLLIEQGYLCAYTMLRLESVSSCHIEHIQAQTHAPQLSLEYTNMAACYPANGGNPCGYGAPFKAGNAVVLNRNFVSPHGPNVNERFTFNTKGYVTAAEGDEAAEQTISLLALNDKSLQELRAQALQAHGIGLHRNKLRTPRRTLSAAAARRFSQQILSPDANGYLEPFCVALSQAARQFAEQEEKRAARLCHIR